MKRIFSILLALALVLGFSLVTATPVAAQSTYYVATSGNDGTGDGSQGNPWLTIQHAVDTVVSGDTIMVAAGTYSIATQVSIDKALTLQGEHAATTIIDGPASMLDLPCEGLLAVDGVPGNVKISGFTLRNAHEEATTWIIALVVVKNMPASASVTIEDNILIGRNNVTAWDEGIWIAEGATSSQATISNNDLSAMHRAIMMERMLGPSTIENNAIHHLVVGELGVVDSAPEGIYYLTYDGDVTTQQMVDGNILRDYSGRGVIFQGGHAWISDGKFTDVVIQDNTLNAIGSGSEDGHVGITLYNDYATTEANCGVHNAAITGNTITTGGSDSLGIWAYGNNTGIGITGNEITDLGKGLLVDGTPVGFVVSGNDIVGNTVYGVSNAGTGTLDARYNWWGDNSGPGPEGPGSGDKVSANVNYDSWTTQDATSTGTGTVSFTPSAGNATGLSAVAESSLPPAAQATKPINFPDGLFSFNITGLSPGATVTVTITLPAGSAPTQYWKYHASEGGWIQIPMTIVGPPNVIRITLVDGGLGDDDLTVNGVIVDQGGPGPGAVGWETYPVSNVRVLLPWIALVVAIAAGASLLVLRRRRTQS